MDRRTALYEPSSPEGATLDAQFELLLARVTVCAAKLAPHPRPAVPCLYQPSHSFSRSTTCSWWDHRTLLKTRSRSELHLDCTCAGGQVTALRSRRLLRKLWVEAPCPGTRLVSSLVGKRKGKRGSIPGEHGRPRGRRRGFCAEAGKEESVGERRRVSGGRGGS